MSKTNVRVINSPEYIINREKGVIVCKMTVQFGDVFPVLAYEDYVHIDNRFSGWNKPKTFTAIAKHHKADIWNETLGKRIAESKCKRKIYKYYSYVMLAISHEFIKNSEIYTNYGANLSYAYRREDIHLKNLMG